MGIIIVPTSLKYCVNKCLSINMCEVYLVHSKCSINYSSDLYCYFSSFLILFLVLPHALEMEYYSGHIPDLNGAM